MSATQASQPYKITPMTAEEEDTVINNRLLNDERPLRRLAKKFHSYSYLARSSGLEAPGLSDTSPLEEARMNFLIELVAFRLYLKKQTLACDVEDRQVVEYDRERERLESEQITQREQIAQLKLSLEEAQLVRRRKMEYDQIAEKVNTLPTRAELEHSIAALEADIASTQEEQEQLRRNVQARRDRMNQIQKDIQAMNRLGRENIPEDDVAVTGADEEGADSPDVGIKSGPDSENEMSSTLESSTSLSSVKLNPEAKPFRSAGALTPLRESVLRRVHTSSANVSAAPSPSPAEEGEEKEDVEMGEVSEVTPPPKEMEKVRRKAKVKEELEEGEASDQSSELSDAPEI